MYYAIYTAVKQRLADTFGLILQPESGEVADDTQSEVKEIRWFNQPYETSTFPEGPAVLIEFTAPDKQPETKQLPGRTVGVRLHVVSKAAENASGAIPDTILRQHDAIVRRVVDSVDRENVPFGEDATRPLRVARWLPVPKHPGYIVTWVELTVKG